MHTLCSKCIIYFRNSCWRGAEEIKKENLISQILFSESGRRGSNPRPSAWKANALSTELLPQFLWAKMDSNHRSRKTADLQSAPFGHSGICPFLLSRRFVSQTRCKDTTIYLNSKSILSFLLQKLHIRLLCYLASHRPDLLLVPSY